CTQSVQCVAKPRQHNLGRSVLVTTHLAEVNGNTLLLQSSPGSHEVCNGILVDGYFALAVLERPCRRLGPRRPSARPLTLVVSQIRGIVVMRALQHPSAEKVGDR